MIIVNERGEVINYEEAGDNSDDSEDEFEDLDDVGSAIERMLTDNSLEKFLISDSKPENCKWKVCNEELLERFQVAFCQVMRYQGLWKGL
jgi:hypothetical protein